MLKMKRFLLARRRVDQWGVTLSGVSSPLYFPFTVVIAGAFSLTGLYVALSKVRRLSRHLRSPFGFVTAYGLWALFLIMLRGDLHSGNRQLGFMILLLALSFAAPGLCLVRRPLRMLVLSARLGVCLSLILSLWATYVIGLGIDNRYNGGGNAAIMALLVTLGAIVGTVRVKDAPRYLPNGLQYLFIAAVPVFLTETRAVLIVLPAIILSEFLVSCWEWSPKVRRFGLAAAAVVVACLAAAPPIQAMVMQRFVTVYDYYVEGSREPDMISGDIRLVMWKSAVQVIREHPFNGVGTMHMFDYLKAVAGPQAPMIDGFHHVHNFILQELLANGVIGLLLMISILASFLWTVIRSPAASSVKRVAVYFFVAVFVFGLLHDPFYHELVMSTVFLFLAVMVTQVKRWKARRRAGSPVTVFNP